MNLELYLPNKFNVKVGSKSEVGLVTRWTDTEILIKKYPQLSEYFTIMGTLYSTEGVSIILRNLALNPQIKKLIIWTNANLSVTPIGVKGYNALVSLWKNGVDESHNIIGYQSKIHKEIPINIINTIRENVELLDISSLPENELLNYLENIQINSDDLYMNSIDFPEPERSELTTLPSEHVGFSVHGHGIVDTWLKVVDKILRYGDEKDNYKELNVITWSIHNQNSNEYNIPDWPSSLLDTISLNQEAIEKYKDIILTANNNSGTSYTYGERLNKYNGTLDQVQYIINDLKRDKNSRRAFATTLIPEIDTNSSNPPCLNLIQILVDTNNKVNMFSVFRSHDIFKAGISNAYGLKALQEKIATELNLETGILAITSNSAHIYTSDLEDALKLIKCQFWENINTRFDENTEMDYRGIVLINVVDNQIELQLKSTDGSDLYELNGKIAREIATKLAKLDLIGSKDHMVDITIELVKAELSIKSGLTYQQDKMIQIGEVKII